MTHSKAILAVASAQPYLRGKFLLIVFRKQEFQMGTKEQLSNF